MIQNNNYIKQVKFNNNIFIITSKDTYIPTKITKYILSIINYLLKIDKTIHTVLEVGGGSGALCISISKKFAQLSITTIEIQETVYSNLTRNINNHNLTIKYINTDYNYFTEKAFDVIISNPPYIKEQDLVYYKKSVNFININGGKNGMDLINKMLHSNTKFLILELGYIEQVKAISQNTKWEILLLSKPIPRHSVYFCLVANKAKTARLPRPLQHVI